MLSLIWTHPGMKSPDGHDLYLLHRKGMISPALTGAWMLKYDRPYPIISWASYLLEIRGWGLRIVALWPLVVFPLIMLYRWNINSVTLILMTGVTIISVGVAGICSVVRLEGGPGAQSPGIQNWVMYSDCLLDLLKAAHLFNRDKYAKFGEVSRDIDLSILKEKSGMEEWINLRLYWMAKAIVRGQKFDQEFDALFRVAGYFNLLQNKRGWYFHQAKAAIAQANK